MPRYTPGIHVSRWADVNASRGASGAEQWWTRRRLQRTVWGAPVQAQPEPSPVEEPDRLLPWTKLAEILRTATQQVVGTRKRNQQPSFYSPQDEDEIQQLMQAQADCWTRVSRARGQPDEASLRQQLQTATADVRAFKQSCRNRWAQQIIAELDTAMQHLDTSRFFWLLPKLGVHMLGKSGAGQEHFTLGQA